MTSHSPHLIRRRLLLQAAAGSSSLLGRPFIAHAQSGTWPARPVTIVVPFPAGGGTDAFARPLTAQLTKNLGKQVIVDNRGGAGGTVGATIASKAAPDGYTFFMGAVHHTIAPSMYPKLDYNLETDFIPVGLVSNVPQFTPMMEDAARRFVNLVDEFYDRGVNLVLSAATPIIELYDGERLRAEFARTQSRLIQMQSREYLAAAHRQ